MTLVVYTVLSLYRSLITFQMLILVKRSIYSVDGIQNSNSDTLQLVQILFRHGARNPTNTYPTNPYDESDFPGGWGQLTSLGVDQMHELGRFIRFRYDSFISQQYSQYEIFILSSDRDRTILSGLAVASTLFASSRTSTNGSRSFYPNLTPIRTIAHADDNLIGYGKVCPKYEELLHELLTNSETTKILNEENSELLNYVNQYSQLNMSQLYKPFVDFHDGLKIQKEIYNLPLPNWTQPFYNTAKVFDIVEKIFGYNTATDELKILRLSPLLKVLVENINAKILGNTTYQPPLMADSRRKLLLFSGHDYTLIQLMDTLGIYEAVKIRPIYGSALMIELHKNFTAESDQYYIKFYYSNDTTQEPYELSVPGHETSISMQSFLEVVQPFTLSQDWDTVCSKANLKMFEQHSSASSSKGLYYVLGLCLFAFVALLSAVFYIQHQRRSTEEYLAL